MSDTPSSSTPGPGDRPEPAGDPGTPPAGPSKPETPGGEGPNPDPGGSIDPGKQGGWFAKFLAVVEWLGNLLPHPVTLFALFALGVILLSGITGDLLNIAVADPRPEGAPDRAPDGMIRAESLMNGDGFRRIIQNLVSNFVGFVPLGTVLVALLGVGVAEKSGLLTAAVRSIVLGAPKNLVTASLVLAGVLSNTASEMGYVVIVPMGAVIFHSLGRHPLAGLAAAFAGVSGGYSANFLIGTIDPLLAGITEEAARMIDPGYEVPPTVNWYFMVISVFFITAIGTWVTTAIVEPKLGRYDDSRAEEGIDQIMSMDPLKPEEKRGMKHAGVAALGMCALFAYFAGPQFADEYLLPEGTTLAEAKDEWSSQRLRDEAERHARAVLEWSARPPGSMEVSTPDGERIGEDKIPFKKIGLGLLEDRPNERPVSVTLIVPHKDGLKGRINDAMFMIPGYGVLRDPVSGQLLRSPFTRGIVAMIFIFFIVPGIAYGRVVGTIRSDRDVIDGMATAMGSMGLYIVLVFFAAQFVNYFAWTNLGSILAVVGADAIRAMRLDNPLVFIPFILMCCFVNLMLGSASAQWAVTAPIFVPMLMLVGYSPEVIQAAYRIGDSTTNIITPMMSYFGIIFAFACRYDRKLGIGTLISTMLPYSIFFIIGWVALFYFWVFILGMPVGPGAPTYYTPG